MTATAAETRDIIDDLKKRHVRFLLLQFTDLLGVNKAVEIPASQFDKALAGEVSFDGSALEGFARVEEADALLVPDLASFRVFPWESGGDDGDHGGSVARLICDIRYPDGRSFEGCPRTALKRQVERAAALGFTMHVGCEVEFFIFQQNERGEPTTRTLDAGSYFDLVPVDRGEKARRVIVSALEEMRLSSEASHHEVARGQHEIDLGAADPLTLADHLATLRFVVRTIAVRHGLVSTFMPTPINVSWSTQNVSPLIRLAAQRGEATRCENRMPDPSANPYLALAVQLAAGVDGVQEKIDPGEPVNKNIARMSYRERRRFRIDDLPRDLHEALDYLEKDTVVREALGDHIYERYLDAKREEWQEYIGQVSEWEMNRYLGQY